MFSKLWTWRQKRDLEQRKKNAGAAYALALACGDSRSANRLLEVIRQLEKEQ